MFHITRFKHMERREFDCEVVTPLFLGGADPGEAELRAPSLKGALRFWWRALFGQDDTKEMAEREAAIFGSTTKKAVLSVTMENIDVKPLLANLPSGKMVSVKGKIYKTSIINYLAYGLYELKEKKTAYVRKHVAPGAHFRLVIRFPEAAAFEIDTALKSLISFGGLGARSRNGFGSLHCVSLARHSLMKDGEMKNFTSFSRESRLFDGFGAKPKWEDALSEIGEVYRAARVNLEPSHDWKKRKFISMPLDVKSSNMPVHLKNGRHAKPYFLHVNKTEDGKYRGQILYLPYKYKAKPDDKSDQLSEYLAVCRKMNEAIAGGMGGAK